MKQYYKLFLIICFILMPTHISAVKIAGVSMPPPLPSCYSQVSDKTITYSVSTLNENSTVPILYTWSGDFTGSDKSLNTVTVVHNTSGVYTATVDVLYPYYGSKKVVCTATIPEPCISKWDCFNWSECINNQQERNCIDLNKCKGSNYKTETQPCDISMPDLTTTPISTDATTTVPTSSPVQQAIPSITNVSPEPIKKVNPPTANNTLNQNEPIQKDTIAVSGTNDVIQENKLDIKKEETNKRPSIWGRIFSPIKNFWNWIFK